MMVFQVQPSTDPIFSVCKEWLKTERGEVGTIIVKDLSRFGRESIEMGRLVQIVYPSLGVTFIAIQENVNTATGTGLETMPFHNIFNEWYIPTEEELIAAMEEMREKPLKSA